MFRYISLYLCISVCLWGQIQAQDVCTSSATITVPPATRILSPQTTCAAQPGTGITLGPSAVYTTVYTTVYTEFCPTGVQPITYTITEVCTGSGEAFPPTHVPTGFTTTVLECHLCGETPITATLTIPCDVPDNTATSAPQSPTNGPTLPGVHCPGDSRCRGSGASPPPPGSPPAGPSQGGSPPPSTTGGWGAWLGWSSSSATVPNPPPAATGSWQAWAGSSGGAAMPSQTLTGGRGAWQGWGSSQSPQSTSATATTPGGPIVTSNPAVQHSAQGLVVVAAAVILVPVFGFVV